MRPVTNAQWDKMNSHQRSWLVCRALGKRSARVYWSLDSPEGISVGGSYDSRQFVFSIIDNAQKVLGEYLAAREKGPRALSRWRTRYPAADIKYIQRVAICMVRCSVAFPTYAEYDHLAVELLSHLLSSGQMISIRHYPEVNRFMVGDSVRSCVGETLAEAVCKLFLKVKGILPS